MSKKHKKVCTALSYVEHFPILASAVTGCVSISAFVSLFGILIWIVSSGVGIKNWTITAGIKNYKLIIKKKRRNMIK